jgi:HAD superfamily hydrolase (TIGR01549 family)
MIRWVFFDVGNVLLDEDPLTFLVFLRHVEAIRQVHPERTFADLLAEREAHAAAGSLWPVYTLSSRYLDEDRLGEVWAAAECEVRARYDELCPALPGAGAQLERLARHYHLGILANQPRECRDRLERLGWLGLFQFAALSEEIGLAKPDLDFFRRALEYSGASPAECLMVGDRWVHDIDPATRLGLATAWVRWPRRAAKGWSPQDVRALAYRQSLERLSAQAEPRSARERPDLTLDAIAELETALPALDAGAR